ncbi:MAG: hypothetical protein Q8L52_02945 [bacterium]|nr:hypothetical protein [bacterium]
MQIRTDRWHFRLYREGLQIANIKNETNRTDICTYVPCVSRALTKIVCDALVASGDWIFEAILLVVYLTSAVVATVCVNIFTVPLGFGLAVTWPKQDFLQVPFMVGRKGKRFSFAWILIPLYALALAIIGVWPGLEDSPNMAVAILHEFGGIVAASVFTSFIIVLLIVLLFVGRKAVDKFSKWKTRRRMKKEPEGPIADAWRFAGAYLKAKRDRFCLIVEFIDPPTS